MEIRHFATHFIFSSLKHTPTPINVSVQCHTKNKGNKSKCATNDFFLLFPFTHDTTNEKRFGKTDRHTHFLFRSFCSFVFVFFFRFSWLFFYLETIVWESLTMMNIFILFCAVGFFVFLFSCVYFQRAIFLRLYFSVGWFFVCFYFSFT